MLLASPSLAMAPASLAHPPTVSSAPSLTSAQLAAEHIPPTLSDNASFVRLLARSVMLMAHAPPAQPPSTQFPPTENASAVRIPSA